MTVEGSMRIRYIVENSSDCKLNGLRVRLTFFSLRAVALCLH